MRLEQQQELTLTQTLKLKLAQYLGITILSVLIIICALYIPLKNFIRTYKPLPTSELFHKHYANKK